MATGLRDGEKYYPVEHYCIKLRAYPNETQKKLITYILSGVHTFCNMVFYDVQTNNMYTKESVDKQSGEIVHWLDIKQAMKAENISRYRQQNPKIQIVPASAMSSPKYGCLVDASKQYKSETGKNLPVERVKHTYYSKMKPRRSYTYQETYSKIQSSENHNVIYANLCRLGKLKLRGWSDKARFDADGLTNFVQYIEDNRKKQFAVTVSVDNCGDYWVVLHFSDTVYVPKRIKPCNEVGVDVGVKSLATQSDGKKYANKKFKAQERERMACYQRKLSSVWGWSNIKFRNAHKTDNTITPSKNAEMWKLKVAKLNRSIANRRDQWQNIVTSDIVNNNSLIAVESLNVKGMLADERLKDMFRYKRQATKFRDQIADAAMFSFLGKLKYKCDRYERKIVEINRYFPSSKVCHVCGHKMDYMGIEIRSWECPSCHSVHDRDTNAAINILVEGLKQVA